MNPEELISCSLDIGEQMLISGAEIGRVEDSVTLICKAYGCRRVDVFTITSSIVVSIESSNGVHMTQTRRITAGGTDLTRLDRLNNLSRQLCRETPSYAYAQQRIQEICAKKRFPLWVEALSSALIAFSFAIFFGGSLADGLAALPLGFLIRYLTYILEKASLNQVFVNVIASFVLSVAAAGLVSIGIGQDANKLIIGGIMLLIPGIALTNSLRDMISGDIMSGLLRFFNAVLVAAAIAAGYILAAGLVGGAL